MSVCLLLNSWMADFGAADAASRAIPPELSVTNFVNSNSGKTILSTVVAEAAPGVLTDDINNDAANSQSMVSKAWRLWKETWGSPQYVLAPMVNQSELSFRCLVRRHGVQLTYSPMVNAKMLVKGGDKYLRTVLTVDRENDAPLIVQVAAADPDMLRQAIPALLGKADAIDLNCGCPQGIARTGGYGAYLLDKPDLIVRMVETAVECCGETPVTVKLRRVGPGAEGAAATVMLAERCVMAGAQMICVHGRTKEEKGHNTGPADWDVIRRVREAVNVPVVANGGIRTLDDVEACMKNTGAAAVMAGESLLEDPALFAGGGDPDVLALEYLVIAENYNEAPKAVKAHLFHLLFAGLQQHTDLRDRLAKATDMGQFRAVAEEMGVRRGKMKREEKLGYYVRHRRLKRPESSAALEVETKRSRSTVPCR